MELQAAHATAHTRRKPSCVQRPDSIFLGALPPAQGGIARIAPVTVYALAFDFALPFVLGPPDWTKSVYSCQAFASALNLDPWGA
mmetsp:Transcript_101915/g.287612  ORF Transcript_101915/g.287612 Transcript_101915/m.287612 type:complete len:85 (-) Transcript_101915:200-454(-)